MPGAAALLTVAATSGTLSHAATLNVRVDQQPE